MPSRRRTLDRDQLAAYVTDHVFGRAPDHGADVCDRHGFGIELELLTGTSGFARLSFTEARAVAERFTPATNGNRLTVEPGGQLELSSRPEPTLEAACEGIATDLFQLITTCRSSGIDLVALGSDPIRPPIQILTSPRYRAMQAYFDTSGVTGRTMMTNTAALQLNIGLGHGESTGRRWKTATALGPVLVAAFANSPIIRGKPSGWQSTRQRTWLTLDPSRSRPVPTIGDPVRQWLAYALDARVMLICRTEDDYSAVIGSLPFGAWLDHGHDLGWPTLRDFEYHLTTLFPPVRPRGWFELRYLDTLPTPFWQVAAAVVYGVLFDEQAGEDARHACSGTEQMWVDAARLGLGHPALREAALAVVHAAVEGLSRLEVSTGIVDIVATFCDRWTNHGRSPADDRLDDWTTDQRLIPEDESPILAAIHRQGSWHP